MPGYPATGSSIGPYDVGRHLGQGGMGVVFEAVHRDLRRPVALKVLAADISEDPDFRKRFLREAQILARLDSPHVIRVYDVSEYDGTLVLATQLASGGDLQALLDRDGPCPPVVTVDLVKQVALGLVAAHRVGVLHRDVKPSNVLLEATPNGALHAIVCDFGIAKAEDLEHTLTNGVIGTWAYLAPERHEGHEATAATDVYALGCLMWSLLTGGPPYRGTHAQVAMGHLQHPVRQLEYGAPGAVALNPVLLRSMAKAPSERYRSVEELLEDLSARTPTDSPDLAPAAPTEREPHSPAATTLMGTRQTEPMLSTYARSIAPTALAATTPDLRDQRGPEESGRARGPVVAATLAAVGALVVAVVVAAVLVGGDDNGPAAATATSSSGDSRAPSARGVTSDPAATDLASVETAGTAPQYPDFKACMVSDSAGFDDGSFNQISLVGQDQAAATYGVQTDRAESDGETDYANNIARLIADGCNEITTVGFLLASDTEAAAAQHPDVDFATVDNDYEAPPRNLRSITFASGQAAFLAGYLAASQTESGVVGTLGGIDFPAVTDFMEGFRLGVERYNSDNGTDVELLGWDGSDGSFTNDFSDQDRARRVAAGLIRRGADIVMPVTGEAGVGALRAARENGARAIWVDVDGYETTDYGDILLTSVVKHVDVAVMESIRDAAAGGFSGKPYVGTLANGGVGLAPFHDFETDIAPDVRAEIDRLAEEISTGAVQVG